MGFLLYFALFPRASIQHGQANWQWSKDNKPMSDDTYIAALRSALRTFRTLATMLGRLDQEIEESWNAHDVEWALVLQQILADCVKERRRLARSLLLAEMQLQEAGARVPNPRWVPPLWLLQEWEAICGREER